MVRGQDEDQGQGEGVSRITIDDIRRSGHCARGIKEWFDSYDLDFKDFLKNGIEVERFLATGDGMAQRVVELTEARRNG